jgi:hypothetical protein
MLKIYLYKNNKKVYFNFNNIEPVLNDCYYSNNDTFKSVQKIDVDPFFE